MHGLRKFREGVACQSCGVLFNPIRMHKSGYVHDSYQRKFCHDECHDGRRIKPWRGSTCKTCGIQFTKITWPKASSVFARPMKAKSCCHECYVEERRQAGLEQAKSFPGAPVYTCKNCGDEFQRTRHGTDPVYCSRTCHQEGMKKKLQPGNPFGSHRRMRQKHAIKVHDKVSKRNNLRKRDGDDCHICGKPIDFEAPVAHPDSCTIDHVLPIAKGGDSRLSNLKLAHWHCNCVVKQDRLLENQQISA